MNEEIDRTGVDPEYQRELEERVCRLEKMLTTLIIWTARDLGAKDGGKLLGILRGIDTSDGE